ncbi:hypothetical protein BHE74_00027789, partial [Ensete ventricosum]
FPHCLLFVSSPLDRGNGGSPIDDDRRRKGRDLRSSWRQCEILVDSSTDLFAGLGISEITPDTYYFQVRI